MTMNILAMVANLQVCNSNNSVPSLAKAGDLINIKLRF